MASFSVELPWQSFLAAQLPGLEVDLRRQHPAIEAMLAPGDGVLVADLIVDGPAPADGAYAVATFLAPLWRGLLDAYGVALLVQVEDLVWRAPAPVMVELAAGLDQQAWLRAVAAA